MKMYIRMTDREYHNFKMYTCSKKGFNPSNKIDENRWGYGVEAEDWLLETGKIVLIDREPDTRGRIYRDAYLVVHGSEEWINNVIEILFNENVYEGEDLYGYYGTHKTILRNKDLPNRFVREV